MVEEEEEAAAEEDVVVAAAAVDDAVADEEGVGGGLEVEGTCECIEALELAFDNEDEEAEGAP